jgi:hypothetical protein
MSKEAGNGPSLLVFPSLSLVAVWLTSGARSGCSLVLQEPNLDSMRTRRILDPLDDKMTITAAFMYSHLFTSTRHHNN